jgi:hypothetical protein
VSVSRREESPRERQERRETHELQSETCVVRGPFHCGGMRERIQT